MKNDAYYIARYQTFSSLINKLPVEREKITPRGLLMSGFVDDSLKDTFEQEFNRILPTIPANQKLTFSEQTSYNIYFAQYPEKVAGVEKKTTSIQFPLKIVGDKELVIKTIRNGMKRKENAPVKVNTVVAEKSDFDKDFNFYYPKKRETDFVNICLNLGVSEVKKANANQQNWIYMLYKGFWFLVLDNGGEFKVFRRQDDGDTVQEMLGWIYLEEHESLNSIAKELIGKFEDYFEDNKPKFILPVQQKVVPVAKYKVGDMVMAYNSGQYVDAKVIAAEFEEKNGIYFYSVAFDKNNISTKTGIPEKDLREAAKLVRPPEKTGFKFAIGDTVNYTIGTREVSGKITDRYYSGGEQTYRITFPNNTKEPAVKEKNVIGLFLAQDAPKFKSGDKIKQNNIKVVEKVIRVFDGKYLLQNVKTLELDTQPINLINATYYLLEESKKPKEKQPEPKFKKGDSVQVTAEYLREFPAEKRGTNKGFIKDIAFFEKDKVWGYDVNFVQDNRMEWVTEKQIESIKSAPEPKFKVGDIVKGKTWDILGTVDAVITESTIRPICYVLKNARGSDYAISYFKNSITGQVIVDEADLEFRFKESNLPVEKILWAVKKGEPDWKEEIITNKAERFENAKKWATANGFDRFRESEISDDYPYFKASVVDLSEQSTANYKYKIGDGIKILNNSIEGVVLSRKVFSGKNRYLINALKGSQNDLVAYNAIFKDNQKLLYVFESKLEPINKVSDEEKTKKLKLLKLKLKLQTQTLLLKQRQ